MRNDLGLMVVSELHYLFAINAAGKRAGGMFCLLIPGLRRLDWYDLLISVEQV